MTMGCINEDACAFRRARHVVISHPQVLSRSELLPNGDHLRTQNVPPRHPHFLISPRPLPLPLSRSAHPQIAFPSTASPVRGRCPSLPSPDRSSTLSHPSSDITRAGNAHSPVSPASSPNGARARPGNHQPHPRWSRQGELRPGWADRLLRRGLLGRSWIALDALPSGWLVGSYQSSCQFLRANLRRVWTWSADHHFKAHRKLLLPSLSASTLAMHATPIICGKLNLLLALWHLKAEAGKAFDAEADVASLTKEIIVSLVFGVDLGLLDGRATVSTGIGEPTGQEIRRWIEVVFDVSYLVHGSRLSQLIDPILGHPQTLNPIPYTTTIKRVLNPSYHIARWRLYSWMDARLATSVSTAPWSIMRDVVESAPRGMPMPDVRDELFTRVSSSCRRHSPVV